MFVTTEPIDAYRELLRKGEINADSAQQRAVDRLQSLYCELSDYSQQMGRTGWRARLAFRGRKKQRPKGVYMWGGVGRGKTMLMDLFFEHNTVEERQHVHFHGFMQEVHRRVHAFREAQKVGKVDKSKDPLTSLARVIAEQAWLLCFDEFHVTDITDAMILGGSSRACLKKAWSWSRRRTAIQTTSIKMACSATASSRSSICSSRIWMSSNWTQRRITGSNACAPWTST